MRSMKLSDKKPLKHEQAPSKPATSFMTGRDVVDLMFSRLKAELYNMKQPAVRLKTEIKHDKNTFNPYNQL